MPTSRRLQQLGEEGALHSSTEVAQVASLLAGFLSLLVVSRWILNDMVLYMQETFSRIADNQAFTRRTAYDVAVAAFARFAPEVALVTVVVAFTAAMAIFLQTNYNVKKRWIKPKFDQLNPANGIKRILSPNGVMNTAKSVFKLILILPVGYHALKRFAPEMIGLIHLSVDSIFSFTADAIFFIFWKIMYILIAFAIFDYFWSRFQWYRQNKMTKEEVKDERKSTEGDEVTKRKIAAKGLQRVMERIQASVPQADVVITNPTHYAVALKYDRNSMVAPKVVAKGKGFIALRIRKIAKEAGVPVLERKPLARALYASVEVGREIPHELFKAVAEVLAYVYRLKNPYGYKQQYSQ
ncbi:MAG: EscU/YscU/HrcU family type III secretion system export apparatus switch protein [Bdellovibrionales bacterium]|nr:EscU/YscU/HrcU family type III secretion system export apparatus switch protein [Bdellovibrionales bacterium]